jgi:hypothetical protein
MITKLTTAVHNISPPPLILQEQPMQSHAMECPKYYIGETRRPADIYQNKGRAEGSSNFAIVHIFRTHA